MAKKNWRFLSLAVFVLCFIFAVPAVHAIEQPGSLPHYTGGNEDFFAGALPPAGTQVYLNYFLDYQMTGFNGNNRDTKVIPGLGRESFAGQAVVNAFRYVSVTKHKALGGDIVWHIIVPVVYAHIAAAAGGSDLAHGSETSIGDVEFGVGHSMASLPDPPQRLRRRHRGADRPVQPLYRHPVRCRNSLTGRSILSMP